jgi:hypothetical protein
MVEKEIIEEKIIYKITFNEIEAVKLLYLLTQFYDGDYWVSEDEDVDLFYEELKQSVGDERLDQYTATGE